MGFILQSHGVSGDVSGFSASVASRGDARLGCPTELVTRWFFSASDQKHCWNAAGGNLHLR